MTSCGTPIGPAMNCGAIGTDYLRIYAVLRSDLLCFRYLKGLLVIWARAVREHSGFCYKRYSLGETLALILRLHSNFSGFTSIGSLISL